MTTENRRFNHWPLSGPPFYLGGLALLALVTGVPYFLFPELATIHYDLFARPAGAWARRIGQVLVSPTLAAAWGWGAGRLWGYTPWVAALAAGGAILVLRVFRSPVIPAISASILPVALRVQSVWYVPAILVGTGGLVLVFWGLRRQLVPAGEGEAPKTGPGGDPGAPRAAAGEADGKRHPAGVVATILFVLLGMALAPELNTVFPPPLAVVAFEMFTRQETDWGKRPATFLGCLVLGAVTGVTVTQLLPFKPLAVGAVVLVGILVLRGFRLHLVPALAVGVLPILVQPGPWYIVMVGGGALVILAGNFVLRPNRGSPAQVEG